MSRSFTVVNTKSMKVLDKVLRGKKYNTWSETFHENGILFRLQHQWSRKQRVPVIKVFLPNRVKDDFEDPLEDLIQKRSCENLWH